VRTDNLLKSLFSVSGMTLLSRVVGFIRDMLMAKIFGANGVTDAFNVAFKLPNLLRRVFAEGAFSQAFVPILAEYKNNKSELDTKVFIQNILGTLSFCLLFVVIIGMIFTNAVILFTAPGFTKDPFTYSITSELLKITLPYIFFISIASLLGSILNSWRCFIIPAFTPTILNLSFIVFAIFFRQYFHPQIKAMAWAVFIGGILQLAFQIPYVIKLGISLKPKFNFKDVAVVRVLKLMLPAIFAMSIAQISLLINTMFASYLPRGSISWMYYADRLMEFPTGVLGVALGTILLPNLSKYASQKDIVQFSHTLDWGIKLCFILALPATIGIAILAKPITMSLFMYGKFTMYDVNMTANALVAYTVGLVALIMIKVFAPGFYANQDIKTPVKIAIIVLIITQCLNFFLIHSFKHVGLALSISIGACFNATMLIVMLIKKKLYIPSQGFVIFFLKVIIAVVIMSIAIILAIKFIPFINFTGNPFVRIFSLVTILLIAIKIYFVILYLLRFRLMDFK
jgi:putative peptidoglycan lipid II flippase